MEEALMSRLLATASLVALGVPPNIYFVERPAATPLPCIVINNAHSGKDYTHDGLADLQYDRIQFDCYGRNYSETKKVERALASELETAEVGATWIFEEAHRVSGSDMPTERLEGGTKTFRTTMDFMVPHRPKLA